jgi:hypothetical protein
MNSLRRGTMVLSDVTGVLLGRSVRGDSLVRIDLAVLCAGGEMFSLHKGEL